MQIHDISVNLSPRLPVWPGDPSIQMNRVMNMDQGDICNVTRMELGVHSGTHVDAPLHFVRDGGTVENLDLNVLVGPAFVAELPDVPAITLEVLENAEIPDRTKRVLLKTRNSQVWDGRSTFYEDYVPLNPDGAEYLVKRGVKLVGVDYLSVAPFDDPETTHRILLNAGVIIVEGLNLSAIKPGSYALYCLPLKLEGSEGAPARTILIEE